MYHKRNLSKAIGIIISLLFLTQDAISQNIKVVSATSQGWAGGICCRTGVNYNIQLRIVSVKHPLKLDSLWMEGYCVNISKYNSNKLNGKDTCSIKLQEGITFDEGMPTDNWCFDATKKGIIISYYQDRKKKWLDITPYIKELEFQAYP